MFRVAHVLVRVPTRLDLLKSGQRIVGAIGEVSPELGWTWHDFLRGAARQLRRLARLLLDENVATDRLYLRVFLHYGRVGVGVRLFLDR